MVDKSSFKLGLQRIRALLDIRTPESVMATRLKWVQVMLGLIVCFYLVQSFVCDYKISRYIHSAALLGWFTIEYYRVRRKQVVIACWLVVAVSILVVSGTAMIDGQGSSYAMWFFPVVPLMAGQLLGNRAVLVAAGASLLAVGAVMLSESLILIPMEYPDTAQDLVNLRVVVLAVCSGVSISAKRTFNGQTGQLDRQARALNDARLERDEARRSASVFLASMSGHVRSPMIQLVERTQSIEALVSDQHAHLARDAAHCARRVSRLVHDIVDLSDLENSRLELRPSSLQISCFIEDLRAWFEAQNRPDLEFSLIAPDEDRPMRLDWGRLLQICTRLMENSLKFSEAGSLTVSLEICGQTPDASLFVRVKDDGIGIDLERQQQVMERFAFYCDTQANLDKGAGVSLVLARQLARAMGGDVVFETRAPGQGTCILVEVAEHRAAQVLAAA